MRQLSSSVYINETKPRLTIAIVEDSELDFEVCRRMLLEQNPDHTILHYTDGASILSAMHTEHEHPDCILLDMNLPDINGREVLEKIRAVEQDIPVLFLTAVDNDMQALSAIAEGADDYLVKGEYNHQTLAKSIAYAIERKQCVAENRILALSLEEAKAINQKQREFVSLVSHELRTPLSIVSSSVYLMKRKLPDDVLEENHPYLLKIEQSVMRLSGLVNNVLTYSRYEQDNYAVAKKAFHFDYFIKDVLYGFMQQHLQTEYVLEGDEIGVVVGDNDLFEYILVNLLSNATKYADAETPKVKVVTRKNNDGWHIDIIDNGRGIPADELEQIGDRFYRASNSADKPGVGIGVFLVKRFLQLQNGTLSYHSTLGEGTTATASFPISMLENHSNNRPR